MPKSTSAPAMGLLQDCRALRGWKDRGEGGAGGEGGVGGKGGVSKGYCVGTETKNTRGQE